MSFQTELIENQQLVQKRYSMLEYVKFGEQDREDFKFEKDALNERISKGF